MQELKIKKQIKPYYQGMDIETIPAYVVTVPFDQALSEQKAKEIEKIYGGIIEPEKMRLKINIATQKRKNRYLLNIKYGFVKLSEDRFVCNEIEIKEAIQGKKNLITYLPVIFDEYISYKSLCDDLIYEDEEDLIEPGYCYRM